MTKRFLSCALLTGCLGLVVTPHAVHADPILINTTLLGDPRPTNPDNLRVNVSITGDTTTNVTFWTVDLDMASYHPYARLNEFGFNLVGVTSDYTFSNFNLPYTPTVGTLDGSGNTTFMLTLDDPTGNRRDATNITSLTFNLTKNTGTFAATDFLSAPESCSSDSWIGCNQLGAHIMALGPNAEDSGVAVGDHPIPPVPEPATLLLLGAGLVGGIARRARNNSRAARDRGASDGSPAV